MQAQIALNPKTKDPNDFIKRIKGELAKLGEYKIASSTPDDGAFDKLRGILGKPNSKK